MSDAPVFGRLEKPAELDLSPFPFTLIGYKQPKRGGGEPVEASFDFMCNGVQPFGAWLMMLHESSGSGIMAVPAIVNYIEQCLVDDKEREKFRETLALSEVQFSGQVLGQILDWLAAKYAERPTPPPTVSDGGQARTGTRSAAGAGAKGGATSRNGRSG